MSLFSNRTASELLASKDISAIREENNMGASSQEKTSVVIPNTEIKKMCPLGSSARKPVKDSTALDFDEGTVLGSFIEYASENPIPFFTPHHQQTTTYH